MWVLLNAFKNEIYVRKYELKVSSRCVDGHTHHLLLEFVAFASSLLLRNKMSSYARISALE